MMSSVNISRMKGTGSSKGSMRDGLPFDTRTESSVDWEHGGYHVWHSVTEFFRNPKRQVLHDLDLMYTMKTLLESTELTEGNMNTVKELAELQRMTENTKARKRLERWSSRLIGLYLLCVLVVVIVNYTDIYGRRWLNIPDNIITIILTTTTVNIIALVVIVLKGHFFVENKNNK